MNDASTDSSDSIIDKCHDKTFIKTYTFASRVTTGKVRNIGLDLANEFSSEYVTFCDSDDLLDGAIVRNILLT